MCGFFSAVQPHLFSEDFQVLLKERIVELESGKSTLRKFYCARRNALTQDELSAYSIKICGVIRKLDVYRKSECVAGFSALGAEPDLSSLFPEKRFFLPRYNAVEKAYEMVEIRDFERDMVMGRYKILEPHPELEAADIASKRLYLQQQQRQTTFALYNAKLPTLCRN